MWHNLGQFQAVLDLICARELSTALKPPADSSKQRTMRNDAYDTGWAKIFGHHRSFGAQVALVLTFVLEAAWFPQQDIHHMWSKLPPPRANTGCQTLPTCVTFHSLVNVHSQATEATATSNQKSGGHRGTLIMWWQKTWLCSKAANLGMLGKVFKGLPRKRLWWSCSFESWEWTCSCFIGCELRNWLLQSMTNDSLISSRNSNLRHPQRGNNLNSSPLWWLWENQKLSRIFSIWFNEASSESLASRHSTQPTSTLLTKVAAVALASFEDPIAVWVIDSSSVRSVLGATKVEIRGLCPCAALL